MNEGNKCNNYFDVIIYKKLRAGCSYVDKRYADVSREKFFPMNIQTDKRKSIN